MPEGIFDHKPLNYQKLNMTRDWVFAGGKRTHLERHNRSRRRSHSSSSPQRRWLWWAPAQCCSPLRSGRLWRPCSEPPPCCSAAPTPSCNTQTTVRTDGNAAAGDRASDGNDLHLTLSLVLGLEVVGSVIWRRERNRERFRSGRFDVRKRCVSNIRENRSKLFFSSGFLFTWQVSRLSLAGGLLGFWTRSGQREMRQGHEGTPDIFQMISNKTDIFVKTSVFPTFKELFWQKLIWWHSCCHWTQHKICLYWLGS